jgi:hypothetical protein
MISSLLEAGPRVQTIFALRVVVRTDSAGTMFLLGCDLVGIVDHGRESMVRLTETFLNCNLALPAPVSRELYFA